MIELVIVFLRVCGRCRGKGWGRIRLVAVWELSQGNRALSMTKKHRAFDQGFKLLQKLGRAFPNTAENRGKRQWTHCPFCGERLHMWRETSRGALCVRCSTIGCFAMTELAQPSSFQLAGVHDQFHHPQVVGEPARFVATPAILKGTTTTTLTRRRA
jgi:hypothetical protein